jgi:DNA-formamidopyrimidine glycosylase
MPEGPEVTIIAEGLHKILHGNYITKLNIDPSSRYAKKAPDGFNKFEENLPLKIVSVQNKGKLIYWTFDNNHYAFQTLGLSGVWHHHKKPNCSFTIDYQKKQNSRKSNTLYFMDQRHFATIKFVDSWEEVEKKLKSIGPDMLNDKDMNYTRFKKIMEKYQEKNIVKVLMDQKIVSGIGNYLKSEILYHCRLSPHNIIKNIPDSKMKELYQSIRLKIVGSYNQGGASLRHYADIEDKKGLYEFTFEVYNKKEDKLGNKVKAEDTLDKRRTYWVPELQKMY